MKTITRQLIFIVIGLVLFGLSIWSFFHGNVEISLGISFLAFFVFEGGKEKPFERFKN